MPDCDRKAIDVLNRKSCNTAVIQPFVILLLLFLQLMSVRALVFAQGRQNFTLFGDIKVDTSQVDEAEPLTFDVFLYKSGNLIARQKLANDGRYRFMNLIAGDYEVVVEIENREVARVSKLIAGGQYADDVRLDINLAYRPITPVRRHAAALISVAESYPRSDPNKSLHEKSIREIDN